MDDSRSLLWRQGYLSIGSCTNLHGLAHIYLWEHVGFSFADEPKWISWPKTTVKEFRPSRS